jgi:NitT/TauT family transport system substrate-binding protein
MRPVVLSCTVSVLMLAASQASAETPIRFVMDWAFEGPQAMWTSALDSGCFASKGLKVTIDRGFGSGDSINKVASGTYDVGVADFSSIIAYNAAKPDNKLLATFVVSDRSPTSVVTLRKNKISGPKDLEGKRIADTQGEASRVLFPVFADKAGIDASKVSWVNVTPALRAAALVQGQSEAVAGHLFTVIGSLRALGVKDDEMQQMPYSEAGVDLIGSSIMARPQWLSQNKEAMQAFISCSVTAIKAAIADPKASIATLKKYNSMANPDFDIDAINFSNSFAIQTPQVKQNGLSEIAPDRLKTIVDNVARASGVTAPAPQDVYTADYLPPKAERQLAP